MNKNKITTPIVKNGVKVVVRQKNFKKISLDDLVSKITYVNLHKEIDWGKPYYKHK